MAAKLVRIEARLVAVAFSVGAHAIFLLLFLHSLSNKHALPEAAVMSVELVPPWPDRREHSPSTRPLATEPARTTAGRRVATLAPSMVEPRVLDTVPATEANEDASQVLRQALGCQHARLAGLTAEERERCLERLATSGKREQSRPTPKLRFDKGGAFDTDDTPYLALKPKNGCKVGAGGKSDAMGKEGAVAGVNCAWSF
jgi:hypothetical protein